MNNFIFKIYLVLLSVGFTTISILLFPISRQASSWNRCLRKTSETLSQVKAVEKMNDESREVLSVMICNGAVFEPKFSQIFNKVCAIIFRRFDFHPF